MNRDLLYGLVGVVAAGAGFAAGYKFAERKLENQYRDILDTEIELTRRYYENVQKVGYETPADAVADLITDKMPSKAKQIAEAADAGDAVRRYQGRVERNNTTAYHKIGQNEPAAHETFDYDAEVALRTRNKPFIITAEEYLQNQPENEQTTLTYYSADETLAEDSDDSIIEDVVNTVGVEHLERFGHGSNDPHLVYVRNPFMNQDFEISWSDGAYDQIVNGTGELKHSVEPIRRRRRHLED